ncbi:sigma-70 family RNA polymerase sigma factor [Psychroserpens ponticola]|uniref:Sigma-70 family RNA polymerase sigma factor n=1 Tax=Psychroserpens ponticola TaxID=2932268 RepID=A0ABY7RUP4_9FLAO|nr:sigma-70 family RNA polymerase sigma factor [Psychroserpens ponticola]WCO00441.1 sigma-70 family RNA polymerase sigma factor [Psychroserpens ponticola]
MEPLKKNNKQTDEELVSNIVKNNDTLLFEVLYDRFASLVYNKCYGFAKDEDEAKDLTQDVFLKLFVKLASFKGKSKFSTWLYAFTYNHCVNYVTRNTAKKFEKQSVDYADIENISEEPNDEEFNDMRIDKLKQALELVSPEEKMILLLKYQDNLSIREIVSVLDIGESAVKMRIKRAKDKLLTVYNDNLV